MHQIIQFSRVFCSRLGRLQLTSLVTFDPFRPKADILLIKELVKQLKTIAANKTDQYHELILKHIHDSTSTYDFQHYVARLGVRNLFSGK